MAACLSGVNVRRPESSFMSKDSTSQKRRNASLVNCSREVKVVSIGVGSNAVVEPGRRCCAETHRTQVGLPRERSSSLGPCTSQ